VRAALLVMVWGSHLGKINAQLAGHDGRALRGHNRLGLIRRGVGGMTGTASGSTWPGPRDANKGTIRTSALAQWTDGLEYGGAGGPPSI